MQNIKVKTNKNFKEKKNNIAGYKCYIKGKNSLGCS